MTVTRTIGVRDEDEAAACAIRVEDLAVRFAHDGHAVDVLSNVSLTIPEGQFVVLIGPSGGGKSTLLNVISGLLPPTDGVVHAHGRVVTGPDRDRGMVFQRDTTFPWMRVEKNIAYGLRAAKVPASERERIAGEYLRAVGLEDFGESWPKQLSGGMRKRVAVATAFASDPKILMMDEPFGSLDFVTRTKLHLILLELWQRTAKTIVFVTHDVDEALLLADRILVVAGGGIADDIPVAFDRPRTDELRALPAAMEMRRHLLHCLGLDVALEQQPFEAGRAT